MISERAKNKPYPSTRRTWAREVDGLRAFLKTLPEWEKPYGTVWCAKMKDYYEGRLAYLLDKGPPKAKRKGR